MKDYGAVNPRDVPGFNLPCFRVSVGRLTNWCTNLSVQGAGGSKVDFHYFIGSYRGECQLPGTFFEMEKYCS